jgi:hypothetical protein
MKQKTLFLSFMVFIAALLVLTACNFPWVQSSTDTQAQVQTMSAATVAAFINQSATQTAQASGNLVIVTATPQSTSAVVATSTAQATSAPTTAPTKTPVPIPCNQASFVTDVTVKDGSEFVAGTSFTKTWRIKNTGSCTWSTDYELYFYSGNSMSAPASVDLPNSVKPYETVDISVLMVAPGDPDEYTGKWMLRSGKGEIFGVEGNSPVTVVIEVTDVPKPNDPNIVYDFIANYCKAEWRTNAGFIACPSSDLNFTSGSITRTYAPILENGVKDNEGALITIPGKGGDGMIQGQYPAITMHDGDHIKGVLLCSSGMTSCSVTFEILAREKGSSTTTSLGTWDKNFGDSMIDVDIDLSSMDGKEMIFYLKVSSKGNSTQDMAQWMVIRVTHP